MHLGGFITIEGTEGAGKTTALKFVQDYLLQANLDVILTREPGGTGMAEAIRKLLLHTQSDETVAPETELLMMFAARAQHIKQCILPALSSGKWVVSDRYIDASYAYQGSGRGIDSHFITQLDQWIVGNLYPDLTLLLDIPPEIGFSRTQTRGHEPDRIEQEKIDFFLRVREGYLQRSRQAPNRIRLIDANQSMPIVHAQIQRELDEFIARKKRVH